MFSESDALFRGWHEQRAKLRAEPDERFNVAVAAEFPEAAGKRFGAVVESEGVSLPELVVERAMYSTAGGVAFAAGTNALGMRLR